jgi:hypothetical protein
MSFLSRPPSSSKPAKPNAASARSVTVNAAFLLEIKEVHSDLRDELASLQLLCSRPISVRSQSGELVQRLADLLDKLALHFSLEEAYGYFDDPVYVNAAFSQRVADLRNEHAILYTQLCRLTDEADTLLRRNKLAALTTIVPVAFDRFAKRLLRHEEEEMELTQEAWCNDLGVGD